jgi:hypothetical protein
VRRVRVMNITGRGVVRVGYRMRRFDTACQAGVCLPLTRIKCLIGSKEAKSHLNTASSGAKSD